MKVNARKLVAAMIVAAGISLLLYPWIRNWLYSWGVDSSVEVYEKELSETDTARQEEILETARKYNTRLARSSVALTDPFVVTEDPGMDAEYESILSLDKSGLMCFVEIPKIKVRLPVYHGTSEEVLEKGAGHLKGSSVPAGGESTHAVLSAHTGINASKMFSDLTEMETGDLFFIRILDETLAYRVCDIEVILPEDTGGLVIKEGKDLVSLITCTPYGVNTHRLVVTGERTEYTEEVEKEAQSEEPVKTSQWMKAYRKALLLGLTVVAVAAFLITLARKRHVYPAAGRRNG